jgi:DNA mismatch endonuclease (patch repair protein)
MMSAIRGRDTAPEMAVRRYLHRQGFRFRLHDKRLPGRPDIVLPKYRTVVDVRGCFWHCHEGCKNSVRPKSRAAFWDAKLRGNVERDARNFAALEAAGWRVIVVWECEVDSEQILSQLAAAIKSERDDRQSTKPLRSAGTVRSTARR